MSDYDRLKVVVAGDSGVGKTAFVHLLCYEETLPNPSWTIGCSVELLIFPRPRCVGDVGSRIGQSRTADEERYFVEFWDIGGPASHANTRSVFYDNIHGVILVHDLTNKKSEANLDKWLTEITSKGRAFEVVFYPTDTDRTGSLNIGVKSPIQALISSSSSTMMALAIPQPQPSLKSSLSTLPLPVLVVGTKLDQVRRSTYSSTSYVPPWSSGCRSTLPTLSGFAASRAFPEITLNCNSADSLAENSHNGRTISTFLQQVVRFKKCNKGVGKRDSLNDITTIPTTSLVGQNVAQLPSFERRSGGAVTYRMPNF
ncbi:Rab-like protein 3 [Echinococcus granulosus]|uniref:Rab protein 3 n=1 Tax=Echinococcus granulosus TaxID=6210 RepID=U6J8R3_ECHGR|nr:Rab-like protein 3 [Echinococcus granulosus]EUB55500.1 Rab-like protein 3 [Echinococcus granulosus]CDS20407.1 rab protein 3 [Echinococcus granulosus]